MNNKLWIVLVVCITFIGCSEKVQDLDNLIYNKQVYYKGGLVRPYSGFAQSYYDNGDIYEQVYLKNGKYDSIYKAFYESGSLEALEYYSNGLKQGVSQFYDSNGDLVCEFNYDQGLRHGESYFFAPEGFVLSKETYDRDRRVFAVAYFPRTMIKLVEGACDGEIQDGLSVFYYTNGQIKGTENYKQGVKHGDFAYYYKNGQLRKKSYYQNGIQEGESIEYTLDGNTKEHHIYKDGQLIKVVKGGA